MYSVVELNRMATQVRRDLLRMIHAVNSGHPGGSLGCTDLITALYFGVMNHNPKNFSMNAKGEDAFFLSNGHLSAAWYSVLARAGYFNVDELSTFRKLGTRLQGHPTTAEHLEGIRIASGSLGQGLSAAIGLALSKKMEKDDSFVYCLMGDGELQEGQVWEAAMFAGAKNMTNMIAFVDYNGQQIDGTTDQVVSLGNLHAKWEAFNWNVLEMNGNKMEEILETINKAKELNKNGKPTVVLMRTEMGFGVDFMMGSHKWHGVAPNNDQLANALSQLEETIGDYKE